MEKDTELFECSCGDIDHIFRVTANEDLLGFLFFEFCSSQDLIWYDRVWMAIKYIFSGNLLVRDFALDEGQRQKFYLNLKQHIEKERKNAQPSKNNRKKGFTTTVSRGSFPG